ncbi:MAG: EAL domain-containing protein [Cyanobacteria bacterium J06627_15]
MAKIIGTHQASTRSSSMRRSIFSDVSDFSSRGLDRAAEDFFLRQEFQLDYQPVLSLDQAHIGSFEALLHLRQPQHRAYPADYIALLENTSLRQPLTRWILQEASQQVQHWHHYGPLASLSVSVNLSARQLRQGTALLDQIEATLADTGVVPSCLQLEIPGAAAATPLAVADTLKGLKHLGLQLYLDNFSPYHHSLEVLQQLPLDAVKITQPASPEFTHLGDSLKSTLHIANDLGMQVIAKRIETPTQLDRLRSWGIRYGQGFLFAHPLPSREATLLAVMPHPIQEFSLVPYLTAMNKLSRFLVRFLGLIVVKYWRRTQPPKRWLQPLQPLASGEFTLTASAPPVIDLRQQQDLRRWTQACLGHCSKILPTLPTMLQRADLTVHERGIIGLDDSFESRRLLHSAHV